MVQLSRLVSRFRRWLKGVDHRSALLALVALAATATLFAMVVQQIPTRPQSEVLPLSETNFVPGEFLVKFKAGTSPDSIREFNQQLRVEELEYLEKIGVYRLKVPQGFGVPQMVDLYGNHPDVEFAEPNYIAEPTPTPTASNADQP